MENASGTWQPKHIILAGWQGKADRSAIELDATRFLLFLPDTLQAQRQQPWAL